MIASTIDETRTEEDFVRHIHNTVATDPAAGWIFVVDNLNTHCSEGLVRYVAKLEQIGENELGNVCQTVPLDIHRTSHHRRNHQTPGDLEGKLGKMPGK
ncbi:MAG: transposase [Patescibacteria group bacterium]|nr:transposase [Patescibacteria group bacterium]